MSARHGVTFTARDGVRLVRSGEDVAVDHDRSR